MDERLFDVYKFLRNDPRWPEEITVKSLKEAFLYSGYHGGNVDYWADSKYVEIGMFPQKEKYTWAYIAKVFRQMEVQNEKS